MNFMLVSFSSWFVTVLPFLKMPQTPVLSLPVQEQWKVATVSSSLSLFFFPPSSSPPPPSSLPPYVPLAPLVQVSTIWPSQMLAFPSCSYSWVYLSLCVETDEQEQGRDQDKCLAVCLQHFLNSWSNFSSHKLKLKLWPGYSCDRQNQWLDTHSKNCACSTHWVTHAKS